MHDPGYGDEHPRCWQSKEEAEEYYFGGKLDYGVDYDLQKKKHVRFIKDISKSYSAEGGFKQALIGSTMFITAYKAIFIQLVDSVFDIIVAVSFLVNIEYGTSSSFLLLAATWIGFSEEAVELFFEFTWCVMTCCAEKCIHGIILLAVLEFFGCVLELGFGIYLSIQILDNDDTFLFAIIICIVQGIMILIVLIACCFSNKYFKQSLSLNKEANLDKFADTSLPYIYTWEVQIEERKIWDSNTDVIKIGIGQYGKSVNYDENTDYNYGFLHKMEGVCKQNTYRYFCGQKYTDPMSGEGANVEWADGDMIRMELDVLNKTLKAYRNGYSLGEAIPDVEVGEGIKYYCMAEEQQYNSYQYKNKPTTKVNIVSFVKYSSE